jgi:hypothetical protein
MKTTKAAKRLLKLGSALAVLLAAPTASAQLAFTIVAAPGSSESVLDDLVVTGGTGSQSNPVKLSVSLKEIQQLGRLQVSGLTKIGKAGSTIYKNSAWLEITIRNTSSDAWGGALLGLFNRFDKSIVTDGLSFASLSDTSATKFDPTATSVEDLGVNPWNFNGAVDQRGLNFVGWDPAKQWPNGSVVADFLGFAAADDDQISVGEEIKLNLLLSQNGKDNHSFLNLAVIPAGVVPEVPWTGVVTVSLLAGFAVIRRRFLR